MAYCVMSAMSTQLSIHIGLTRATTVPPKLCATKASIRGPGRVRAEDRRASISDLEYPVNRVVESPLNVALYPNARIRHCLGGLSLVFKSSLRRVCGQQTPRFVHDPMACDPNP